MQVDFQGGSLLEKRVIGNGHRITLVTGIACVTNVGLLITHYQ
jgi:hypothetical protein